MGKFIAGLLDAVVVGFVYSIILIVIGTVLIGGAVFAIVVQSQLVKVVQSILEANGTPVPTRLGEYVSLGMYLGLWLGCSLYRWQLKRVKKPIPPTVEKSK